MLRYADYEELLTLATAKRVLLLSTGSSSDTILPRIGEYGRNLFRWFGAEDRFSTRQMSTEDRADAVNIISSWFTEKPLANALEDDFVPLVDDPDLACLPQPLPRPARITNVMWQQFLKARLRVSLDSSQPFENAGDPIKDDRPRTVGLQIRTAQAVRFPTQGITISGIVYRPGVDGGGAESGILIAVDDEGSGTPTDDPVLQAVSRPLPPAIQVRDRAA